MVRTPGLLAIFAAVCGVLVAVAVWQVAGVLRTPAPLDTSSSVPQARIAPPPPATAPTSEPIAAPPPPITPAPVKPSPPASQPVPTPTPASAPVHWATDADQSRALSQLAAAREALTREPRQVHALEDELAALRALGRTSEAEDALERLVELEPDNRPRRMELAESLMRTGEWMRAIATLETAVTQAPDDVRAWYYLAGAQQAMGHLGDARHSWDRVIALQPDNVEAAAARGALLLELHDWPAAEADLARAALAQPDDPAVAINYSVALVHVGRDADARQCVLKVLEHNPRHIPALNRLAEMAWQAYRVDPVARRDQLPATIDWCRRALEVDPQQPMTQKLLDTALAEQRSAAP